MDSKLIICDMIRACPFILFVVPPELRQNMLAIVRERDWDLEVKLSELGVAI